MPDQNQTPDARTVTVWCCPTCDLPLAVVGPEHPRPPPCLGWGEEHEPARGVPREFVSVFTSSSLPDSEETVTVQLPRNEAEALAFDAIVEHELAARAVKRVGEAITSPSSSDGGEREALTAFARFVATAVDAQLDEDVLGGIAAVVAEDSRVEAIRQARGVGHFNSSARLVADGERLAVALDPSSPPAGGEGDDELVTRVEHELLEIYYLGMQGRPAQRRVDDDARRLIALVRAAPPVSSVEEGRRVELGSRWRHHTEPGVFVVVSIVRSTSDADAITLLKPDESTRVVRSDYLLENFTPAGEGRDAPAREEEWQILCADGTVYGWYPTCPPAELVAWVNATYRKWAPVRVQRRERTVTAWVDVPACEDGGDDGDR